MLLIIGVFTRPVAFLLSGERVVAHFMAPALSNYLRTTWLCVSCYDFGSRRDTVVTQIVDFSDFQMDMLSDPVWCSKAGSGFFPGKPHRDQERDVIMAIGFDFQASGSNGFCRSSCRWGEGSLTALKLAKFALKVKLARRRRYARYTAKLV